MVEVEYLITLSKEKSFLGIKPFPKTREKEYRDLYLKFEATPRAADPARGRLRTELNGKG